MPLKPRTQPPTPPDEGKEEEFTKQNSEPVEPQRDPSPPAQEPAREPAPERNMKLYVSRFLKALSAMVAAALLALISVTTARLEAFVNKNITAS